MCAMDTESDQAVDNDTRFGKRKRSTESVSEGEQNGSSQDSRPHDLHQSTLRQKSGQPSVKRTRPGSNTPGVNIIEPTTTSGDNPSLNLLHLPVEIVQHVLSIMDPVSLAHMMQLNQYLYRLLDPRQDSIKPSSSGTRLPYLPPDAIWSRSRRSYFPHLPYPPQSTNELDMLKLVLGKKCQVCGRLPKTSALKLAATPWNSGPGLEGVRIIWPFKSRFCADCLRPLLLKEADLAQLGAQQLRPGLMPVSFTPSLNYVMSVTLQQQPAPPRLQLTNYFFRPMVDELSLRASEVQALGESMYASWLNSLYNLSQQAATDTVRLENWEVSQKSSTESHNTIGKSSASESGIHSELYARSYKSSSSGVQRPRAALSDFNGASSSKPSILFPHSATNLRSSFLRGDHPQLQSGSDPLAPQVLPNPTKSTERLPPRSNQPSLDVSRLKVEKRADIERRCLRLDPPIYPSTLDRLATFQSALQVLMPLDDLSWETLKVRLVQELNNEENSDIRKTLAPSHVGSPDAWTATRVATPPDEPVEDDPRSQALRPTRDKLYDFAREFVRRRYAHGTNLTHSSAPQFAADVLLYTRDRFYETQAREDAAFIANGQTPPDEGPSGRTTRKLKLEHMRYVFDTSVKPYTEFVRKDLFLCSACDTQGKHFLFEAIIQHFASKHTDSFSRGTAVVHWKAEWPQEPPFHRTPSRDIEWSPDTPYPLTNYHVEPSVRSSETGRITSTTNMSDDHQAAWSDRLSHDPPDFRFRDETEDRSIRRSDRAEHVRDHLHTNTSTPRARSMTRNLSQDVQNVEYSQARNSRQFSTHASIRRPDIEVGRQDRYLRQGIDSPGFVRPYQHLDTLMNEVPMSRVTERDHGRYQVISEPIFDQTRISASTRRDPPSETDVVYHRDYFDRSRNSTNTNIIYDHPETTRRTPVPDVLSRQSLQAPGANFLGPGLPPEIAGRHGNITVLENESKSSAAERFLDSFDPVMGDLHDKPVLRRPIDSQDSFSGVQNPLHPHEGIIGRRPNMSQPRRRGRNAPDEDTFNAHTSGMISERMYQGHDQIVDHNIERYSRRYSQYDDGALVSNDSQQRELRPLMHATDYTVEHDAREFIPLERGSREESYRPQRYRYVDSHGRELRLASPEIIHTNPNQYRQIRYETIHRPDQLQVMNQPYQFERYEQRGPSWRPEAERYRIERSLHDYPPEPRYLHYEELPDTRVVHEEEAGHYLQSTHARPSYEDQRYERRQ